MRMFRALTIVFFHARSISCRICHSLFGKSNLPSVYWCWEDQHVSLKLFGTKLSNASHMPTFLRPIEITNLIVVLKAIYEREKLGVQKQEYV